MKAPSPDKQKRKSSAGQIIARGSRSMETESEIAAPDKPVAVKPRRDGTMRPLIEGKKYKLTIYTGRTQTGKRVYFNQVFRGSASEAKARLRKLATDVDNGITLTREVPEPPVKPEPVLLGDVLDRWLRHKC